MNLESGGAMAASSSGSTTWAALWERVSVPLTKFQIRASKSRGKQRCGLTTASRKDARQRCCACWLAPLKRDVGAHMADWLKHALEWLKTSPRYFFPVAVASGAVLFLPESVIQPLGLISLRVEGQAYLGAAFLSSSCVIACDALLRIFAWTRRKYGKHLALRKAIRRLDNLTPKEQELLRPYLEQKTRTQELHMESGVVAGLVQAGILYPAVPQPDIYEFPFNIQPWAWEQINAHPELVGHTMRPNEALQPTAPPPVGRLRGG